MIVQGSTIRGSIQNSETKNGSSAPNHQFWDTVPQESLPWTFTQRQCSKPNPTFLNGRQGYISHKPKPWSPDLKPYTLHPTPCTLHSTPYTLRPTPYTLHPTPNTLHPAPFNQAPPTPNPKL
ncbi:hypothetical protein T484DRAFT_1618691 [Baffinella frigidus]|nr:hypothetical protein T484DRAFT_1618691 [Cryptophyta sp. CCMP2293]